MGEEIRYKVTVTKLGRKLVRDKRWKQMHTNSEQPGQFAYVDGEEYERVSEDIYDQIVDELDLPRVILAVNPKALTLLADLRTILARGGEEGRRGRE